jgi:hypothetical protein
MNRRCSFCLRFSGITVRFNLPNPIEIPPSFLPFLWEDTQSPDETYTVELLTTPLQPAGTLLCRFQQTDIYQCDKGWLHIFPVQGDEIGCQVACLFCPDGHHTIYYPAAKWDYYSEVWGCSHLICGEQLLLRHNAMLLHSSLVCYQGKALLFSGPSGAGKSTQADLWQTFRGAEILNGDRTVIMKKADGFYGGGSIWSGTSGIYRPEQAPIAGIFLVEKASENRLEQLGFQAFRPLFTQTIVNSWNPDFMDRITQLYSDLLAQVPVYRLYCRPDQEAVDLVCNTIFPKEVTP